MWKKRILWVLGLLFGGVALLVGLLGYRVYSDTSQFPMLVESAKVGSTLLIRRVNVYPGFGKKLLKNRDLLVREGKIHAIGKGGSLSGKGAHVIEAAGRTLLPGLVDAHVHTMSSGSAPWAFMFGNQHHNLQAYLRAGVTTVYDLGGVASTMRAARAKIRKGEWLGPQIFHTHSPITTPNGHPIPVSHALMPWPMGHLIALATTTISKPSKAKELVTSYRQRSDFVKIIFDQLPPKSPLMSKECLSALIRESKRQGVKTFVHIGSAENAVTAAEAGADVLAHFPYRGKLSDEQVARIAKSRVKLIVTLHAFQATANLAEGKLKTTPMEKAMHPAAVMNPLVGKKGVRFVQFGPLKSFGLALIRDRSIWNRNVRRLYQAGVPLLVGTDSALPGVFPGSSYHLEIQALHRAGVPNHVLLEAATSRGAKLLSSNPNYGTIAVGKRADLLLVKGNPLKSIKHLQRIVAVIARGKLLRFLQPYAKK